MISALNVFFGGHKLNSVIAVSDVDMASVAEMTGATKVTVNRRDFASSVAKILEGLKHPGAIPALLVLPLAGCGGGGTTAVDDAGDGGVVFDGYLVGATVYREGSDSSTGVATATGGVFESLTGSGDFVVVGGTDASTGLAFTGQLKAPDGYGVVSPLTTMVEALIASGTDSTTALADVTSALGLTGVDLSTLDPIATGNTEVFKAGVQVSSMLATASSGSATGYASFASSLASALKAKADAGESFDVSDSTSMSSLADDFSTQVTAAGDATLIATLAAQLDTIKTTAASVAAAADISSIASVQSEALAAFADQGTALKGPLHNAIVFNDYNGDGELTYGESWTTTNEDGSYALAKESNILGLVAKSDNPDDYDFDDTDFDYDDYSIVVSMGEDTIDYSSGESYADAGVSLKAAPGGGVITPMTTLHEHSEEHADSFQVAELAAALGIDSSVDILNFNTHADGVDEELAHQVETIQQHLMTTTMMVQAAIQGSGTPAEGTAVSTAVAHDAALDSLIKLIIEVHSANNEEGGSDEVAITGDLDLSDHEHLEELEELIEADLADTSEGGFGKTMLDNGTSVPTPVLEYVLEHVSHVINLINSRLDELGFEDFGSIEAGAISHLKHDIADQIEAMATAARAHYDAWLIANPAAPTPTATGEVISLYSDAFTNVDGTNWNPNWGQAGSQTDTTLDAFGNVLAVTGMNYQGVEFASAIDASGMESLHIDFWLPEAGGTKFYLISDGAEYWTPLTGVAGWNSIDVPLSHFETGDGSTAATQVNLSAITQMKMDSATAPLTATELYLDNIYFSDEAVSLASAPEVAAPTPDVTGDVISLYSDAFTDVEGTNWNPNWGQAGSQTDNGSTLQVSNMNYQGVELASALDVSGKTSIHVDFWLPEPGAFNFFLISNAGTDSSAEASVTLTGGPGWNSVDIALTDFTGVDLTAINQLKMDANPWQGGANFVLDNIYFSDTAASAATTATVPDEAPTQLVDDLGDNELRADARLVDTNDDGVDDSTLVTLLYDADSSLGSIEYSYRQMYLDGDVTDTVLSNGSFDYETLVLNAAPGITSDHVTSVNEDSAYSYAITAVDAEGTDVTLSVTLDGAAIPDDSWLSFSNNTLSGTPDNDDVGTYALAVTALDEDGQSATETFTLTVVNTNDAPVLTITPDTTAAQGEAYTQTFSIADVDVGDEVDGTVTVNGVDITADDYDGSSWLSITDNEDGSFTLSGTPTVAEAGTTQTVVITASDGEATDTETVAIAVSEPTQYLSFDVSTNSFTNVSKLVVSVDIDALLDSVSDSAATPYFYGGSFSFTDTDGTAFDEDIFTGGVGIGANDTQLGTSPFATASFAETSAASSGEATLVLANTSGTYTFDVLGSLAQASDGTIDVAEVTFVELPDDFSMQVEGTFTVADLASNATTTESIDQVAFNVEII